MNAVRGTPLPTTVLAVTTLVVVAGLLPRPAAGQALADRVQAEDGLVRFAVPTREGVEICDEGIRIGEQRVWWHSHGRWDVATRCRPGPVEVEVTVRDGFVRRVEALHRSGDRAAGARELGTVEADDAVRYLESLARGVASDRAARDAIFPMVLADVPSVWRELLSLARDRDVPSEARKNSVFWLGQEAAAAATDGLADMARDEDEEQDVRDAAVFALSQRPHEEGLPALMQVARTAREPRTRRTAMFWLAQSEDPRVVAFFEEILVGRAGG